MLVNLAREIAQGVLGSDSLIITLDDLKNIIIDIKIPESFVGILKKGLKAEVMSSSFREKFLKEKYLRLVLELIPQHDQFLQE